MVVIDRRRARADLVTWLAGLGLPHGATEGVVDHVLAAEVVGRRSHGIRLLPWIATGAGGQEGDDVVVTAREPGTLLVAALGLPGIYAVQRAMEAALTDHDRGRQVVSIAVTGYFGSTGCLGLHVRRLAQRGATGFVAATSPSIMAPPGTATALLGTNAMALGAPVSSASPLIVDFSSTTWSYGDVALARSRGKALPDGVVLDRSGAASTDPRDVVDGSLVPSGGHRGWAQALLVEALAGAAVGGKVGLADGGDSSFVLSIGPDAFGGSPPASMKGLIDQLRSATPGPDGATAHLPGERYERLNGWPEAIRDIAVEPSALQRLTNAGGPRLDR